SGNVSLYNETEGTAILPTPAIGGLGVIEDGAAATGIALAPGLDLVLIGETRGELGASLFLREILRREDGAPPSLDLAAEKRNGDFVRRQIHAGAIAACHDVSDGGLLVALAEMAIAGNTGIALAAIPAGIAPHAFWFGEDQARYVAATSDGAALLAAAAAAGIPARALGRSGGDHLTGPDGIAISLKDIRAAHEAFFARWFA
ncbi:MAG: phosphoribosylformylglycinamidine synthase II, partial [Acidiphilium sp. 21-68-69]